MKMGEGRGTVRTVDVRVENMRVSKGGTGMF